MYKSEYIFKNNLTIEIIKHNNHIIIKNDDKKRVFIGYSLKYAINDFNK